MKPIAKIIAVSAFLAFCSISLADELLVPSQYPTIQAAIDAAIDGDTVIVAPGTYTGTGNRDISFKSKAITVRSADPNDPNIVAATIIDCNGVGRSFYFHNNEDANSILEGFTIIGHASGGGISCLQSSPTITHCNIMKGRGISCRWESNANITNCTISNNKSSGIYCEDSSPTITNCTISGNKAAGGGGIYCDYDSNATITNCTITGNTASGCGGGICCYNSSSKIINCIFWNNSAQTGAEIDGIANVTYSDVQGGYRGQGNINADPLLTLDGHLQADSPCIDAGDPDFLPELGQVDVDGQPRIMGGRIDMGVDEVTAPLTSTIVLSSRKFDFNVNEGGPNPQPQILSIRNILEDTLNWE
ncbi:MAG: right-handed parallel beta-helix repeat-containing protein, partial [Sedimentisphaerales bacterium]|nr:right-handed parallel beta-helix repeat-containing protein [Sedimentisphaerales bacterium]